MHHLDRAGRLQRRLGSGAQMPGAQEREQRPDALAGREQRIAHGGREPVRRPLATGDEFAEPVVHGVAEIAELRVLPDDRVHPLSLSAPNRPPQLAMNITSVRRKPMASPARSAICERRAGRPASETAMSQSPNIVRRKDEHIAIALAQGSNPAGEAPFDRIRFEHCALPEMHLDEVRLETTFLGFSLRLPFLISSMTGGPQRGSCINENLATAAEALGIALAVGSQRVALERAGEGGLTRPCVGTRLPS